MGIRIPGKDGLYIETGPRLKITGHLKWLFRRILCKHLPQNMRFLKEIMVTLQPQNRNSPGDEVTILADGGINLCYWEYRIIGIHYSLIWSIDTCDEWYKMIPDKASSRPEPFQPSKVTRIDKSYHSSLDSSRSPKTLILKSKHRDTHASKFISPPSSSE